MKSILQHVVGFVRDHPLLIGRNDEGGDSARGGADLRVVPRVGGSVDPNTKPCQLFAYRCTDLRLVFPNAGRQRRDFSFSERSLSTKPS